MTMKIHSLCSAGRLVLASLLLGSVLQATPITVANYSFETTLTGDPNTDWGFSGGGWGTYNFSGLIAPAATDGSMAAYGNGGVIYQILGSHTIAEGTYTVQLDLGQRSDTAFGGFSLSLFSVNGPNGVVGLGAYTLPADPPAGGWSTLTAVVPVGNASLAIGGNLQLNLNSFGVQTLADNVRVDFAPAPVPEPTSLALLGLGGFSLLLWRNWRVAPRV